jgi:4-hydroxybenzoate polyprenyltransferase
MGTMTISWKTTTPECLASMPADLKPWLIEPTKLMRQLKKVYPELHMELLGQTHEMFLPDDQVALKAKAGWVREIRHVSDNQGLIYARVSVPEQTYQAHQHAFDALGGKPIGQTLFYYNKNITRTDFEFAPIDVNHPAYKALFAKWDVTSKTIWARRSQFLWDGKPLMLTEYFVMPLLTMPTLVFEERAVYFVQHHVKDYIHLIRLHRPMPILILLWPVMWALWIAGLGAPSWGVVAVFLIGGFLMRSAGDIINDIADRKFDGQVERTAMRPLATGRISIKAALIFAVVLALIAFALVVSFLNAYCIVLSFVCLALACVYPFMKRFTHWPQLVLGLAYNFGVLMAFAQLQNHLSLTAWLLYGASISWTLAYDTMYAVADKKDDVRLGLKSTALGFGQYYRQIIAGFEGLMLALLTWVGVMWQLSAWYYVALACCIPFFVYQDKLIKTQNLKACIAAFSNNHWVGLVIFVGVWVGLRGYV